MAINPVSTGTQSGLSNKTYSAAGVVNSDAAAETTGTVLAGEAAVYEKSEQTTSNTNTAYTRDTVTISEISKQVEAKLASLRATVEKLFNTQSVKNGESQGLSYDQILAKYDGKLKEFYQNLEVDEETKANAQQEISEDGFWGVKQTAARTLDFAKALAGGDPARIDLLRKAIQEGYAAAEKAWGGQLPEICRQTQAAIMQGLDEWAQQGTGQSTQPEAESGS